VQATKAPPSSAHWKLTPPSLALKASDALALALGSGGACVIVVAGASVSTVQDALAAAPVLPAGSVARTETVWRPSARPL
jgi:hypothetical protein